MCRRHPGGLAFELGASQAEDRGWGPMSLKTGAGGATGFALLMDADVISLRPPAAVREADCSRERERQEEGVGEKEGGRWSVCVCEHVCVRVSTCACVCTCIHACWSEKREWRLQAERSPKKVLDGVPWEASG